MGPDATATPVSRRTVLGAAAVPFVHDRRRSHAPSRARTRRPSLGPPVTLATYNLYLGAMPSRLLGIESVDGLRRAVGRLFETARANDPAARMAAIADEIAAAAPALVGVQEAALVRTEASSDGGVGLPTDATDAYADYLALLRSALEDRGVPYDAAAELVTADVELPASADGETFDLRVTDRLAVLARRGSDVAVRDSATAHFDRNLPLPVAPGAVRRGYCAVRAEVGGAAFTFVTTHLESWSRRVRRAQARELVAAFGDADAPTVVAGDLNSGPGESSDDAYEVLRRAFADANRAGDPASGGMTCCHAGDLRNPTPAFDRRVDHVLVRGPLRVVDAGRLGLSRTHPRVEGSAPRWPSDHAGVVVTVRPADAPADADGATTARTARPGTARSVPGFGVAATLVALGVAAARRLAVGD